MIARRAAVTVTLLALGIAMLPGPAVSTPSPSIPSTRSTATSAPKVTVTRLSAGGYKVAWTGVSGATGYTISREKAVTGSKTSTGGYLGPNRGWMEVKKVSSGTRSITTGDYFEPELSIYSYSLAFRVRPTRSGRTFTSGTGRAGCASGYFIGLRGSGENPDRSGYSKGLGSHGEYIYSKYRSRIGMKNSTLQANAVPYPAVPVPDKAVYYGNSKDLGRDSVITEIKSVLARCPKAKVVAYGFSQGAHALGDGFQKLPASVRGKLMHVLLFSDPARNGGDTGITHLKSRLSGGGYFGSRPKFASHPFEQISTWCWSQDKICKRQSLGYWHGSAYSCYRDWAGWALAVRARYVDWKPRANVSKPSCTMKP